MATFNQILKSAEDLFSATNDPDYKFDNKEKISVTSALRKLGVTENKPELTATDTASMAFWAKLLSPSAKNRDGSVFTTFKVASDNKNYAGLSLNKLVENITVGFSLSDEEKKALKEKLEPLARVNSIDQGKIFFGNDDKKGLIAAFKFLKDHKKIDPAIHGDQQHLLAGYIVSFAKNYNDETTAQVLTDYLNINTDTKAIALASVAQANGGLANLLPQEPVAAPAAPVTTPQTETTALDNILKAAAGLFTGTENKDLKYDDAEKTAINNGLTALGVTKDNPALADADKAGLTFWAKLFRPSATDNTGAVFQNYVDAQDKKTYLDLSLTALVNNVSTAFSLSDTQKAALQKKLEDIAQATAKDGGKFISTSNYRQAVEATFSYLESEKKIDAATHGDLQHALAGFTEAHFATFKGDDNVDMVSKVLKTDTDSKALGLISVAEANGGLAALVKPATAPAAPTTDPDVINIAENGRIVNGTITHFVVLGKGSVGDFIKELHARLKALGYTDGAGKELDPENATWNDSTAQAVVKLQKAYGLDTDELFGEDSLCALEMAEAEKALNDLTDENRGEKVKVSKDGKVVEMTRQEFVLMQYEQSVSAFEYSAMKTLEEKPTLKSKFDALSKPLPEKVDVAVPEVKTAVDRIAEGWKAALQKFGL